MRRLLPLLLVLSTLSGCALVAGGAVTTGALMIEDRRATRVYLLDEDLEWRAQGRLMEPRIEGVHANFTAFNGRLLITGEAPTEAVKTQVAERVRDLANVREVFNELVISAPTSLASRTTDGYTTAKIKARLIEDDRFSAAHIKVVTENGVAFLMGLVKREEANAAAEVTARTAGVRRVVKVFEYLD